MKKNEKNNFIMSKKCDYSFFNNFFDRYLFCIFKILFIGYSNMLVTKKCFILISEFIFAVVEKRVIAFFRHSKNCFFHFFSWNKAKVKRLKYFFTIFFETNIFTSVSLNKNIFSNYNFEDFLSSWFFRENWWKNQFLKIFRNTDSNVSKLTKSTLF